MAAEPRLATPRMHRPTYGGEVAKLAQLLGFEPVARQRLFWDVALEHEAGGLAYRVDFPRFRGHGVDHLSAWVERPGQGGSSAQIEAAVPAGVVKRCGCSPSAASPSAP